MQPGTKVTYWPERLPFLANVSYPATVLGPDKDNAALTRLSVQNTKTGRVFHVSARASEGPASGCFTATSSDPATTEE